MNIGYIGKFNRIHDEEGLALALEKIGVNVTRIDQNRLISHYEPSIKWILKSNIDYLLAPKWSIPAPEKLMASCRRHNIIPITYHSDAFHGLPGRNEIALEKKESYAADIVCTPEGYAHDVYKKIGINHYVLRQGIHNQCCYRGVEVYQEHDVVFIGNVGGPFHEERPPLIEFLKKTYGDKFLHLGEKEDEIRGDHLNDLIASSKIIIGESVSKSGYWSNRLYETIGRGGFCLHVYNEGIENEYEIGKHFDVYYREKGYSHLKEKIDYWLKNEKERKQVANQGMLHTQKNHTLINRAAQLVDILNKNK